MACMLRPEDSLQDLALSSYHVDPTLGLDSGHQTWQPVLIPTEAVFSCLSWEQGDGLFLARRCRALARPLQSRYAGISELTLAKMYLGLRV